MSSRSNSSARNRRAGPNPNIQDSLTSKAQNYSYGSNYSNVSSMQQNTSSLNNNNDKQEHKLLSITQAFMLINGKIRNLETQVDTMNKIIETHNISRNEQSIENDHSVTPQAPNYEEMSDVSEFKQNIDDDFYDQDSKTSKLGHEPSMIAPMLNHENNHLNIEPNNKVMFDESKAREVAENVTTSALQNYDEKINNLDMKSRELESEYNKLNSRTSEISEKLNSIEQLIKNIETLNTKLPDFMDSVESRFENLKLSNNNNETLVRDIMSKVDGHLDKYNTKIENVQTSMSNMQEYAVSLHNLVIKRFDSLVEEKFIPKSNANTAEAEISIEEKGKKVLFDMQKNETTEIENCLESKGASEFNIPEYDTDESINGEEQEVESMNPETLETTNISEETNSKKKKKKGKNSMKLEVDSEEPAPSASA